MASEVIETDINGLNDLAIKVTHEITTIWTIADRIEKAASSIHVAQIGAIAAINQETSKAIAAVKAAILTPSGNADNPKFQEPHKVGFGPGG